MDFAVFIPIVPLCIPVAEMQERLDFAERLLTSGRATGDRG